MVDRPEQVQAVTGAHAAEIKAKAAGEKENLAQMMIIQEETSEELGEWGDNVFNPLAISRRFKPLQERTRRMGRGEEAETAHRKVMSVEKAEEAADKFAKQNPELDKRALLTVQARIKATDSAEEILAKVLEAYPDPFLADETLDYLLEIAEVGSEIHGQILKAKEDFNAMYGREIRAGRNMATQARDFSNVGLGSPTGLRDLYRDITGNPRDPHDLFEELTSSFTYSKMRDVIDFLLHSLGADMKSKGPSISRAELERLFTETRILQGFLGLFRFFQKRMPLIEGAFAQGDLDMPGALTYETLGKLFMQLLKEKYPSPEKVKVLARALGISADLIAQVIVYTQYRDACRGVSPRLFHSEKHRQDLLTTLIETISDIDDELEELSG